MHLISGAFGCNPRRLPGCFVFLLIYVLINESAIDHLDRSFRCLYQTRRTCSDCIGLGLRAEQVRHHNCSAVQCIRGIEQINLWFKMGGIEIIKIWVERIEEESYFVMGWVRYRMGFNSLVGPC